MNRLTALLYLQDPQTPTARELRDQATKTFVALIANHEYMDGILEAQVDAYMKAREYDGKDADVATGGEIEKIFLKASLKGYREHVPDAQADSESLPWWPDGMSLSREWPVNLMKDFGYLAGFRDGLVAKQLQAYAKQHNVAQAT